MQSVGSGEPSKLMMAQPAHRLPLDFKPDAR